MSRKGKKKAPSKSPVTVRDPNAPIVPDFKPTHTINPPPPEQPPPKPIHEMLPTNNPPAPRPPGYELPKPIPKQPASPPVPAPAPEPPEPTDPIERLIAPQPIVRLEWIRIVAPLAILGFMSSRMIHADDWLSNTGFHVPALDDDWRQPMAFAGLPVGLAWALCATMLISGLATAAGAFTRIASAVFAATLVYVALADRLAAFTVSKISPIIVIAICLSPAGARYSIDAWRKRRRDPSWQPPTRVTWGNVRFFQVMLAVFYFASGIAKARGDWWSYPDVLWTHLHDSYQTPVSWFAANYFPSFSWGVFQKITLAFELGAPVWFALRWTRPFALVWALGMHLMIGLMFGPVIWFSLLMMSLLIGAYAPTRLLQRVFARVFRDRSLPRAQIARRK